MQNAALVQEINNAIGSHGAWKMRLRSAIRTGQCDVSASTACCDDQCAFGKWLHGPHIESRVKAGVPYQVIKRLHAEFHQSAGSVLSYVERGNIESAVLVLDGAYAQRSEKLVRALTKWKFEIMQPAASRAA